LAVARGAARGRQISAKQGQAHAKESQARAKQSQILPSFLLGMASANLAFSMGYEPTRAIFSFSLAIGLSSIE